MLDAEFRELSPPPSREERERREFSLALGASSEPLIVWRCGQRRVLLVGYEIFEYLQQHGTSCPVIEKGFAGRDQARMFIILHLLSKTDLGALWVSYLRGLRYEGTKQPRGGDRRSQTGRAGFAKLKSAEALAEILCVTPRTVRRQAEQGS